MNTDNAFNVKRAAQVTAYFAKVNSGPINVLKLMKLIYLADRHSMSLFDSPILNDKFMSMNKGPVNFYTHHFLKIDAQSHNDWVKFVSPRSEDEVSLASPDISISDLDQLSRADLRVLGDTWATYGHLDGLTLADLTHEICPEWSSPNGASTDIPFERIFKFLGRGNSEELAQLLREQDEIDRAFL